MRAGYSSLVRSGLLLPGVPRASAALGAGCAASFAVTAARKKTGSEARGDTPARGRLRTLLALNELVDSGGVLTSHEPAIATAGGGPSQDLPPASFPPYCRCRLRWLARVRLFVACAIALAVWVGVGRLSAASWAALSVCFGSGIALAISRRPKWAELAPIPVILFNLAVLVSYVAWPHPPEPYRALLSIGATAVGLHLALAPLGRRSTTWRVLARLALSLAVLAFSFAAAARITEQRLPVEPYALRTDDAGAPQRYMIRDPLLGNVLRPGYRGRFVHPEYGGELVEINPDGFRGADWPMEPDPGALRVLLLGDSSVFGMGTNEEQTISAHLERLLEDLHPSGEPRVFNLGVPGYGPRHVRILLERHAARLGPRLALVLFQDSNDLEDCRQQFVAARNLGLHAERLRSEELHDGRSFSPPDLLSRPDARETPPLWSRVYWVRYTTLGRNLDREIARRLVRLGWAQLSYSYNHEFLRAMRREPDLEVQEDLRLALEAVRAIEEDCARQGIVLGLIRLPGLVQCEPDALRGLLESIGQDPTEFDRRLPGSTVVADANRRGIPTLDLLPLLEVGERQLSPCFYREGHPNPTGNLRIAQAIQRWIREDARLASSLGGTPAPGSR